MFKVSWRGWIISPLVTCSPAHAPFNCAQGFFLGWNGRFQILSLKDEQVLRVENQGVLLGAGLCPAF